VSAIDQAEAGVRIALDDLREAIRESADAAREAAKAVDDFGGLGGLLVEIATIADATAAHFVEHPEKTDELSDATRAEWSTICSRRYDAERKIEALARAYVAARKADVEETRELANACGAVAHGGTPSDPDSIDVDPPKLCSKCLDDGEEVPATDGDLCDSCADSAYESACNPRGGW